MKTRKSIGKIMSVFCLVLAMATVLSVAAGATYKNGTQTEIDDVYPNSNVYYLPSNVDMTALELDVSASYWQIGSGEKKEFKGTVDITGGKTTDRYGNTCYKVKLYVGQSATTYTFYILSEIPNVYVETSTGVDFLYRSKENRDKSAEIIITDENGNIVYDDVSAKTNSEIKSRGNATFGYAKKPYQIKLAKKTDLFGMGKAKTWILLANYMDSTFIRNAISFEIADTLGLAYSPKSTFVNLYIDNEFCGLYQLCEKTQIGTNRIEITDLEELNEKANDGVNLNALRTVVESPNLPNLTQISYVSGMSNPADITGGYLIELDNIHGMSEKSWFRTANNNVYTVKSPECASREQVLYIAALVSEMEEAIYSASGKNSKGKHFSEYVDVESLIAMYMTYEITKNWDAYVGSTFFYKDKDDGGKTSMIYAGPAWDFDHSFGNLKRLTYDTDKTELWAAGTKRTDFCRFFGAKLIMHDECKELLAKYATLAADKISEMLADGGFVKTMSQKLYDSAAADKMVWGYQRSRDFEQFEKYVSNDTNSSIGFLTDFMRERAAGIYKYFVGKDYVAPASEQPPEETTESTTVATTEATPEPTTAAPTTEATIESTTAAPTTETTIESTTAAPTTVETVGTTAEETTEQPSGGCGSAISSALVVPAALAVLFFVKKKKKSE